MRIHTRPTRIFPIIKHPLPALFWGLFVLIILLIPGDSLPSEPFLPLPFKADKLVHGALFFVQAWTLHHAFHRNVNAKRRMLNVLGVAMAYAVFTEFCQLFVPYRTADVMDVLANGIGIGLFLLLQSIRNARERRSRALK